MDKVKVSILITVSQCVTAMLLFVGLTVFGLSHSPKRIALNAYEMICMRAKRKKGFDYEKWEAFLRVNGAEFHYGRWINPVSYIAICIVLGICGYTIGMAYGVLTGILGAGIFAFLPGILLEYLNVRDNEKMLPELDMIYSALAIQIRAGVFVADALSECYGSVNHSRLKTALQDLTGDLVMKSDLVSALGTFQGKFSNKYIDTLCITILQACESGQAVELLGDIADQIKDMEVLLQQKRKEQLNRSATFYQLGIFVITLGLTLYLCVSNMFSAAMFF